MLTSTLSCLEDGVRVSDLVKVTKTFKYLKERWEYYSKHCVGPEMQNSCLKVRFPLRKEREPLDPAAPEGGGLWSFPFAA